MATKTVFFDFGGTLFVIRHHKVLQTLLHEEGRDVGPGSVRDAYFSVEPWWLSVYGTQELGPDATEEAYRVLDMRVIMKVLPNEPPSEVEVLSRLVRAKAPELERSIPPELYPDALPALRKLKDGGLEVGLVSNATAKTRRTIEATGLADILDPIIISAEVRCLKPNPKIFRIALDAARSRPEEAIHVGDIFESDVVGARNAGMEGILIDRDGRSRRPDCPTVSTLHQVLAYASRTGQDRLR